MNSKGKVLTITLVFLLALSLAGIFMQYSLYNQEKKNRIGLEEKLQGLQNEKKNIENSLENKKQEIVQLQKRLEDASTQIKSLQDDLQSEKKMKESMLLDLSQAKTDLDSIKEELNREKEERNDLKVKLEKTLKDFKETETQLEQVKIAKSLVENKLKELDQQGSKVELGKIVVTPEQSQVVTTQKASIPIEASILSVNKKYNFIVINVGQKDGVKVGDIFSIYRNNKYIVNARVEETRENMSVANLEDKKMAGKIKEGDVVIRQ